MIDNDGQCYYNNAYCVRLIRHIAPLLGKPEERFNWNLETDKIMSKVVFTYFIFCIISLNCQLTLLNIRTCLIYAPLLCREVLITPANPSSG